MTGVAEGTPSFEIRLLGALEAIRHGRPLRLGGRQSRNILAVLLLHPGQTVPKHRLIEYAWQDDPPLTAEDLVAAYLSRLRRVLNAGGGEIALLSVRPGFRAEFDPELVDVHRFTGLIRQAASEHEAREDELATEHLQSALALWPGNASALADVESDWLRAQRQALDARRYEALELLATLHLEAGRPAQAGALLRDVASAHPERESLTVTLIRALSASGEAVQAAALAARTAEALLDLGQEPGPALRAAQSEALARRTERSITQTGPRHQLPADTRAFTGREAELTRLLEVTAADPVGGNGNPGKVVICAIDGMAGIGKSALAIHLAHRLRHQYPEGQLFVDLHGHTEGYAPRTIGEVLDTLLRTLGMSPLQIPQNIDERATLYRELLADTRTLILLDNADSEAQVRQLLPGGAGCLVLVTSRKRLKALDDAYSVSLDPLPLADGVALFRTVAGHGRVTPGDPALEETVALCGGVPLALRIAAALLRHRPAWNPAYLVRLLRDQGHRLTALTDGERDLTAIFDLSYDGLADDQRRAFRRLGLLPGPSADAYAAAALFDLDLRTSARLLESLFDHNLLSQPAPDRYQFHDLIRIYARTRAEEDPHDGSDVALDRLFDYYLSAAQEANRYLARRTVPYPGVITHPPRQHPTHSSREQAAAWMHANLADLAASVDYAASHARPEHAIAVASALHGYLYIEGPWPYALDLHSTAAEAAHGRGDDLGEATALHSLGRIRRMTGEYQAAATAHQRALELYRGIDHRLGQANALDGLGRIRLLTADFRGAAEVFERALDLFHEVGDQLGQAGALNGLGRVRRLTGNYRPAADAHQRALGLCRDAGDRIGEATALNDLGRALCDLGDLYSATKDQTQALQLYQEAGHRLGQANALNDLGRIRYQLADYAEATRSHDRALQLYREMGHRLGQANALTGLGRARSRAGEHASAAEALERALRLFREVGDRQGEAEALNRRACVHTATNNPREARTLHSRALRLARAIASPLDEADAREGFGEACIAEGQIDDGADHLRQSLLIHRRLGTPDVDRLTTRLAELTPR